ncbi:MAG: HEAT repeat domain-containing protein [Minicystis sp.]
MNLASLFASDVDTRLGALARTAPGGDAAWAVRDVLLGDEHAEVRAAAAEWLGRAPVLPPTLAASLVDALYDTHPSVRLSACRATTRARAPGATSVLRRLAMEEPIWWVRRAAVVSVARRERRVVIPLLLSVLDDPFWRVRHAAVRLLVTLGERHRDDIATAMTEDGRSDRARAALAYLAGKLGLARELLPGPDARQASDGALADADPAVVAARLERGDRATHAELVEYLGDPHESLRRAASRRLARSGDVRALLAATLWLSEPRIPHAAATVVRLLDGLEASTADAITDVVLADPEARPGAAVWALSYPERRLRDEPDERLSAVYAAARAALPSVRRAAVAAAGARLAAAPDDARALECLSRALGDEDEDVRRIAAFALAASESGAGWRAVVDAAEALLAGGSPLVARQVARAAARAGDVAPLKKVAQGDDPSARAIALRALFALGLLDAEAMRLARESEDPWTRGAVLGDDTALEVLAHDPHPPLRRAAFERAARAGRALEAARIAWDADDAWLRTRVAERLARSGEGPDMELVGRLLFDRDPAVRAAAADATIHSQAVRDRLAQRAAQALAGPPVADPQPPVVSPATAPAPRQRSGVASPRAVGRSGLTIAPLAISGANEPSVASLFGALDAGCNLFFWEPRYRAMTTFLRAAAQRGRAPLVIAGSYHASERAILADIERACRTLGRDRIDVFLLFWARSAARLDGEGPRALARAKQRRMITAAGFSTHDRALALEALGGGDAAPWEVIDDPAQRCAPGRRGAPPAGGRRRGGGRARVQRDIVRAAPAGRARALGLAAERCAAHRGRVLPLLAEPARCLRVRLGAPRRRRARREPRRARSPDDPRVASRRAPRPRPRGPRRVPRLRAPRAALPRPPRRPGA